MNNYAKHLESFSSRNVDQLNCLATMCSKHLCRALPLTQQQFQTVPRYFFFFFLGGSSSELLSVLLLLLLEELESDSNSEEEDVLLEDGEDEEVEELSSLSLSSSEEEVEESSLSDEESPAELALLLLLELVTLLDLEGNRHRSEQACCRQRSVPCSLAVVQAGGQLSALKTSGLTIQTNPPHPSNSEQTHFGHLSQVTPRTRSRTGLQKKGHFESW